jgi:hypothetical protein
MNEALYTTPVLKYCRRCKRALAENNGTLCLRCRQILLREIEPTFGDGVE